MSESTHAEGEQDESWTDVSDDILRNITAGKGQAGMAKSLEKVLALRNRAFACQSSSSSNAFSAFDESKSVKEFYTKGIETEGKVLRVDGDSRTTCLLTTEAPEEICVSDESKPTRECNIKSNEIDGKVRKVETKTESLLSSEVSIREKVVDSEEKLDISNKIQYVYQPMNVELPPCVAVKSSSDMCPVNTGVSKDSYVVLLSCQAPNSSCTDIFSTGPGKFPSDTHKNIEEAINIQNVSNEVNNIKETRDFDITNFAEEKNVLNDSNEENGNEETKAYSATQPPVHEHVLFNSRNTMQNAPSGVGAFTNASSENTGSKDVGRLSMSLPLSTVQNGASRRPQKQVPYERTSNTSVTKLARKYSGVQQRPNLSQTSLQQKPNLSQTSLQQKPNLSQTSLQQKSNISQTSLQQKPNISQTSLQQRPNPSQTSLPARTKNISAIKMNKDQSSISVVSQPTDTINTATRTSVIEPPPPLELHDRVPDDIPFVTVLEKWEHRRDTEEPAKCALDPKAMHAECRARSRMKSNLSPAIVQIQRQLSQEMEKDENKGKPKAQLHRRPITNKRSWVSSTFDGSTGKRSHSRVTGTKNVIKSPSPSAMKERPYRQWLRVSSCVAAESKFIISSVPSRHIVSNSSTQNHLNGQAERKDKHLESVKSLGTNDDKEELDALITCNANLLDSDQEGSRHKDEKDSEYHDISEQSLSNPTTVTRKHKPMDYFAFLRERKARSSSGLLSCISGHNGARVSPSPNVPDGADVAVYEHTHRRRTLGKSCMLAPPTKGVVLRTTSRYRSQSKPPLLSNSGKTFPGQDSEASTCKRHRSKGRSTFRTISRIASRNQRSSVENASSDPRSLSNTMKHVRLDMISAEDSDICASEESATELLHTPTDNSLSSMSTRHDSVPSASSKTSKVFRFGVAGDSDADVSQSKTRRRPKRYVDVQATQYFEGTLPGQLSFKKGQIIKMLVYSRVDPVESMCYGYYRTGRLKRKKKGLFPASCVTSLSEVDVTADLTDPVDTQRGALLSSK